MRLFRLDLYRVHSPSDAFYCAHAKGVPLVVSLGMRLSHIGHRQLLQHLVPEETHLIITFGNPDALLRLDLEHLAASEFVSADIERSRILLVKEGASLRESDALMSDILERLLPVSPSIDHVNVFGVLDLQDAQRRIR